MPLTVGSLFAGIGGFDLGFERAGMVTRWQVEQDEFCRKVLARHFPHAKRYEDVRDVGASSLERVDVLCGGFPCQDISLAGKGAGLDGERSGLWGEYARIIGELRPRYVVVENVSALLGRGLGRVLADLAALRYDAEWDCIPASAVGAPHRRDRLWLVAYPVSRDDKGRELHPRHVLPPLAGGETSSPLTSGEGSTHVADTEKFRVMGGGPRPERARGAGTDGGGWWATEPDVGRVADGVPSRVDRLSALGNALVPQIAEWIGRRIIEWETTG